MKNNHNQRSPSHHESRHPLVRALMVGALAVTAVVGVLRGTGTASTPKNHNTTAFNTQQLEAHYNDVSFAGDTDNHQVEVAEAFSGANKPVDYYVTSDGGHQWTRITNAGSGALVNVRFAPNDQFGIGEQGVVALTTLSSEGDLTVGVDLLSDGNVTDIGEKTINNTTTQGMAADLGVYGPQVDTKFNYAKYYVDNSSNIGSRADIFTETLTTKAQSVTVEIALQGPPIISGTQI